MRLGAVAVLLAALLLSACRDGGETRYRHDFADGHGGWGTSRTLLTAADLPASYRTCWVSWLSLYACNIDAPVQNGRMQLTSPWWLDPNHAPPGAGYLSLITWVYLDGPAGSSDRLDPLRALVTAGWQLVDQQRQPAGVRAAGPAAATTLAELGLPA